MTEEPGCHICTKPFYWRFNTKPSCIKHYQQLTLLEAKKAFMQLSFTPPTLLAAQKFVKGYIEVIDLGQEGQILCDEEFLLREYPVLNANASALSLEHSRGKSLIFGAALHLTGPALWT